MFSLDQDKMISPLLVYVRKIRLYVAFMQISSFIANDENCAWNLNHRKLIYNIYFFVAKLLSKYCMSVCPSGLEGNVIFSAPN